MSLNKTPDSRDRGGGGNHDSIFPSVPVRLLNGKRGVSD